MKNDIFPNRKNTRDILSYFIYSLVGHKHFCSVRNENGNRFLLVSLVKFVCSGVQGKNNKILLDKTSNLNIHC